MAAANLQDVVNERVAAQYCGFIHRAVICANILLEHPEFIQPVPDDFVNTFTVVVDISEDDEGAIHRVANVKGCCFEFLLVLFPMFLSSVEPWDAEDPENVKTQLQFLMTLLNQEAARDPNDRFLEYEFSISETQASVKFENNSIEFSISRLSWVPQ